MLETVHPALAEVA